MSGCSTSGEVGASGQRILGYPILRLVGEGARTQIYLAKDPKTHKTIALKHIVRRRERDYRFIQQVQNEYAVSQKVQHPMLRRCFDLHLKRNLLMRITEAVLVMEYFEGYSMDRLHFRNLRTLLTCFIHTGEALYALNQVGLVHCDFKPQNVLVSDDNEVRVIDLGQACPVGTVKPRIQGTPDFIAPEQVKCWPVTPTTDVFNFGASLYWCLTRKKLPTLFNIDRKAGSFLVDERFDKPHELDPTIPHPLSELVIECVRTSPSKRPQDMTEVLRRLETIRYALTPHGQHGPGHPGQAADEPKAEVPAPAPKNDHVPS